MRSNPGERGGASHTLATENPREKGRRHQHHPGTERDAGKLRLAPAFTEGIEQPANDDGDDGERLAELAVEQFAELSHRLPRTRRA